MIRPRSLLTRNEDGRVLFERLYETEDILVLNKPAGLVCHPTKGDVYSSLISRLRIYLGPHAEVHLINRLDRETSGIVLVGKSRETARILRREFEERRVSKSYLAIVHGRVDTDSGVIDAPLGPDEHSEVVIKDCVRIDGAASLTAYTVLHVWNKDQRWFSLLFVEPHTGRKHQIRIHLQHLGHPIVGDKMYGVCPEAYLAFVQDRLTSELQSQLILPWQALHACGLKLNWNGADWQYECPPESWFLEFIVGLENKLTTLFPRDRHGVLGCEPQETA